jgi:hypothetical protein
MIKTTKLHLKADLLKACLAHIQIENDNQGNELEDKIDKLVKFCDEQLRCYISDEEYERMMDEKDG